MPHATVSERQRSRAKQLRQTMTRAETLLWRHLKAHRTDGLGFRRQFPFRNDIADFACLSAKLIIEPDGESHDSAERQQADRVRDDVFLSEGFAMLRFTNDQVMSNLDGVIEAIRQAASSHAHGTPPLPDPPPRGRRERNSHVTAEHVETPSIISHAIRLQRQ